MHDAGEHDLDLNDALQRIIGHAGGSAGGGTDRTEKPSVVDAAALRMDEVVSEDAERIADGMPIGEVSRRLGVPMPTLRSWELRYGIPRGNRQSGRHRRYTADELHEMRLMRDQISRGQRASIAAESVRKLLDQPDRAAHYIAAILAAAERMDPTEIREHLAEARTELGLGGCLDDVLLPAMQQIGLWWQTGRCDIDQEHLATEAARSWLETLTAYAGPPTRTASIVLACGPTDLHTIGLEALCLLLRSRQWPCRQLGARISVDALAAAVQSSQASAVVIVSHLNTGRRRAVDALHGASALGVQVFYAGNAFTTPRSRRSLPGTYLGTRLQDAVEQIELHLG